MDGLLGNVQTLIHKSKAMLDVAGQKTGINVWDIPTKIADKDLQLKLDRDMTYV